MKTIQSNMTKCKYILMALLVTFSISCSPEDGNDGADGTNGSNGQDGNANVFSSDWFSTTWSATGSTFGSFDQAAPEITQEVLNSDVILIYVKDPSFVYITPIVWTSTISIGSAAELGSVRLYFRSETNFIMPSNLEVKYVIIPSTVAKTSLDYSKMTYEEVMNHFGLEQ